MLKNSKLRRDLQYSVMSGLITGFIIWRLALFLELPEFSDFPYWPAVFVVPIVWFAGVNLGYFLGRWFSPFNQFGRFAAVGFTNAAVDFGILNLFIALTGITAGVFYVVFKTVSFWGGLTNSYVFNKHWTFEAGASGGGKKEFFKFTGIVIVVAFVNVGVASFVVNFINPIGNLSPQVWANVGAVSGSAAALLLSFSGFRKIFGK